ncbi:MAG: hypothetical protein ACYC96_13925 [Fimbriimonadaceae bacterium]
MRRYIACFIIASACGIAPLAAGQQGRMGGGGLGGAQGVIQGQFQRQMLDGSTQGIDQAISGYLNTAEIKSILTPGEFVEWTLKLHAGEVVIAEARSDAFDPALEIVDAKDKVLAANDDRYPGDQRPLLLWRCEHDGDYKLHARCFRDKSGGLVFVRFTTYDSVDVGAGGDATKELPVNAPFLIRIPMKAGQIKEVLSGPRAGQNGMLFSVRQVIAAGGLPDINLAQPLVPATQNTLILAPVAGDYYAFAFPYGSGGPRGVVHALAREVMPTKLAKDGDTYAATEPNNHIALWELSVKAGDLLEASTPDLSLDCRLVLANEPDISKYDVSKPETNPFYPQPIVASNADTPAFTILPARARDGRRTVFYALRDAKLWLASNGSGPANKEYVLRVKPAASDFFDAKTNVGKLTIGSTDYWAIKAKAGDVMALKTSAPSFAEQLVVRDPALNEIKRSVAAPDQTSEAWRLIAQRPGTYLVAVSCMGDGGSGAYSLSRTVFHAKEFGIGTPARGTIANGQVQIWRFTATPDKPLLIHWTANAWPFGVAVYDDIGQGAYLQRQSVDAQNQFGILSVDKPQTYVIVLIGGNDSATYSIQLSRIQAKK